MASVSQTGLAISLETGKVDSTQAINTCGTSIRVDVEAQTFSVPGTFSLAGSNGAHTLRHMITPGNPQYGSVSWDELKSEITPTNAFAVLSKTDAVGNNLLMRALLLADINLQPNDDSGDFSYQDSQRKKASTKRGVAPEHFTDMQALLEVASSHLSKSMMKTLLNQQNQAGQTAYSMLSNNPKLTKWLQETESQCC